MEYLIFLIAPFVCALIGWLTNHIAVKMLFRPRKPLMILGLRIQGIFPRRRKELAESLGALVEEELISHQDIQKVLSDPEFRNSFRHALDEHLRDLLTRKLVSLHPFAGMVLSGKVLESIKNILIRETEKHLPVILEKVSLQLQKSLDFKELVSSRVERFSMDKLEQSLFSIMKKELRFIEMMGAVLGFIIGIFQSLLFFLI